MDEEKKRTSDDALLNLEEKSVEELRSLLDDLYAEEQRVSYRRRVLHGKIDILRAELVRRLKDQRESGGDVVSGHDIERLIQILSSDLHGVSKFDVAVELDNEDDWQEE
ncbi:MAG: RsiG family protein [Coriobacteriia bacterium]